MKLGFMDFRLIDRPYDGHLSLHAMAAIHPTTKFNNQITDHEEEVER